MDVALVAMALAIAFSYMNAIEAVCLTDRVTGDRARLIAESLEIPAVPAYVNVAPLMGPVLAGLGLSIFTAHMFIFYFAVASAIAPPVAITATTSATIACSSRAPSSTGS